MPFFLLLYSDTSKYRTLSIAEVLSVIRIYPLYSKGYIRKFVVGFWKTSAVWKYHLFLGNRYWEVPYRGGLIVYKCSSTLVDVNTEDDRLQRAWFPHFKFHIFIILPPMVLL